MTDLSSFSKSDFSATSWINALVEDVPEGESLESFLTSIGMKLHITAQDYSEQLEAAMVESMTTMPRMVADIARLEDQLHSVQNEMRSISDHLHAVDKKSVAGIEELSRLDHLKANMEKCKSTLEEHARWSQVEREAKQLLENGGILSDTADKIETMFKSLDVLKNLPGHEERLETCDTFRLTLLNALRPNIRKEITDMSITSLQEYIYVFKKLNSEVEFEKEYIGSRPQSVRNLWESYQLQNPEGFPQWLAVFLGTVAKFINEEEDNLAELFGEGEMRRVENLVLAEALMPVKRSLADRLQRIDSPPVMFECYCVTDEFMKRMLPVINGCQINEKVSTFEAVFGGFIKYMPQFLESEDRNLRNKIAGFLTSVSFTGVSGLDELEYDKDPIEEIHQFIENFMSGSERFAKYCNEVLQRCARIFGGVNIKQVVRIVVNSLQIITKLLMVKMGNFAVALGLSTNQNSELLPQADSSKVVEPYPNYSEECKNAAKLGNYILSTDSDRQALTMCVLKALQGIGVYSKALSSIEATIRTVCLDIKKMLGMAGTFPDDLETQLKKNTSFGALFGSYLAQKDENQCAELKSFLAANSQNFGQGMFSGVSAVVKKLIIKVEELVLSQSTNIPSKLLATYSSEEIWGRVAVSNEIEEYKQNLLPQSAVTQVGEHLLSWVQDLESFAGSNALKDLLVLKGESLQLNGMSDGWQNMKNKIELPDKKAVDQLSSRQNVSKLLLAFQREIVQNAVANGISIPVFFDYINARTDLLSSEDADIAVTDGIDETSDDSQQVLLFVNEWLTTICDAVVGQILFQMLEIPRISRVGAVQLSTDIDYLSNVINAMGIKPHPLLSHVRMMLDEDPENLKQAIQLLASGKSLGALKDIWKFSSSISRSFTS